MTEARGAMSRGWERAVREHAVALSSLLEAIGAADERAWSAPREDGAWNPAQLAEHLALTYEAALRELGGGEGIRLRLRGAHRALLRWVLLPHMLFHRTLPVRARSPREVRPEGSGVEQGVVAERLRRVGAEFEAAVVEAGRTGAPGLTHPYFGRLTPERTLRFVAVHMEHHTRQLIARSAA